jgi:hypothetical protein
MGKAGFRGIAGCRAVKSNTKATKPVQQAKFTNFWLLGYIADPVAG